MEEFINSFGKKNLIIVVAVVFAVILSLVIIVLIEKIKEKRNNKDELEYYEEKEIQIKPSEIKEAVREEEEEELIVKEEVAKKIVYEEEKTKEEARKTLEDITKKLVEYDNDSNLIGKTSFEVEQEEKSIISYEELLRASKNVDSTNEALLKDEGTEPITIEELYKKHLEETEPEENLDNPVLDNPIFESEPKKFKNSEVISPVFGVYDRKFQRTEDYLERTMNLDDLELEIKKTEEFLNELKRLKSRLN